MFLNLDKQNPHSLAVIDDSGSTATYSDLLAFTKIFSLHIPPRSLIFILSENTLGALAAYVASLSSSVVPLILSVNTERDLLLNLIRSYQPEYIWLPDQYQKSNDYQSIFQAFGFSLLKTEYRSCAMHDELALLLPTSGSTGSPKLVRHSYRNVEENAKNVAAFFELNPYEKPISVLPMHYTMGLSVITSHLFAGACILLIKSNLTEKKFWDFIKEHQATSFTGVPFSFEILYKLRFFRMNLPHLNLLTQGGGKMSPELFSAYANYAKETGKRFIATYGQTEGTARMAYLPEQLATEKICSIGKAIPNGEFWLVNEEGNILTDPEATGQLVYKGPNVTLGYAEKYEDLLLGDQNNGVLITGDIARRDADGCYYIVGRLKRFLKIYGYRIGLDEIEQLIKEEFEVDCLCSGSDEQLQVMITNETLSDSVIKYIVDKTGLFHQAITVKVVEEIPKNEAGKPIYN